MKKRWVLAAVVAATAAGSFGATSAGADGPTQANAIGKVRIDPNDPTVAYIKAEYRCHGEGALWISVKQTADRSKDPALAEEGSSGISAAWSMSHRNPVSCDGARPDLRRGPGRDVDVRRAASAAGQGLRLRAVLPVR